MWRKIMLALNRTCLCGGIIMVSPVAGFLARLSAISLTRKVPNPRMVNFPRSASALICASRTTEKNCITAFWLTLSLSATFTATSVFPSVIHHPLPFQHASQSMMPPSFYVQPNTLYPWPTPVFSDNQTA